MPKASFGTCCLEIEFSLKPGKRREFTCSLEDMLCHEREGHIKTTVYEDRDEPGHMMWVADWANRKALEEYLRGEEFGVLIGGLRVLCVQANCRLVDEVSAPAPARSLPAERTPGETRLTPVDLDKFGGPRR
jgi:quinol monooxygenase YgiN